MCYTNYKMTAMLMTIAILTISLTALPTSDETNAALNNVRSFPLEFKSDRAALRVTDVNTFITKQINSMQTITNITMVQTRITTSLQVAYGNQVNWFLYVIKNPYPPTFPDQDVSISYLGKGVGSNVSVKPWTVYWTATPVSPSDLQPIIGNEDVIRTQLLNCPSTIGGRFSASILQKCLSNSPITSGRRPISTLIFISANPNSKEISIGSSPRLNTYFLGIRIKIDIDISFKLFGAQVNISIHSG